MAAVCEPLIHSSLSDETNLSCRQTENTAENGMREERLENLCLLAEEELSILRELYQDNIGEEDEPKLMGCLLAHALMTLRSVSDLTRACVLFDAMVEKETEVRVDY